MTLRSTLVTLTLVAVPTLGFLRTSEARPAQGPAKPDPTIEACKQKCLDEYNKNVKDCKKTAKVCNFWILWICAASHLNQDVYDNCVAAADAVLAACLEACCPPPKA